MRPVRCVLQGQGPEARRGLAWLLGRIGCRHVPVEAGDLTADLVVGTEAPLAPVRLAAGVRPRLDEAVRGEGILPDLGAETGRLLALDTDAVDRWSCALPEGTPAGKAGCLEDPPADRWIQALRHRLEQVAREDPRRPLVRIKPWPGGRPFAVHLSHDLDLVRKGDLGMGLRHLAGGWRSPRNAFLGWGKVTTWLKTRGSLRDDPYWKPWVWCQMEERRGFRSDWYVLASTGDNGVPYCLEDIAVDLKEVASGGHEVGLHGSGPSYRETGRLAGERMALEEALGRPVTAIRQHNLSLQGRTTWEAQAAAGFATDASLGFNRRAGWRAGTSHPVRGPGGLLLLPLTAMDGVLFCDERLDVPGAVARCGGLLDAATRGEGLAAFDWHIQGSDAADYPGYLQAYDGLLERVAASGAWCATSREIAAWTAARDAALAGGEVPPGAVLEAVHAPGACPLDGCAGTRCERPAGVS